MKKITRNIFSGAGYYSAQPQQSDEVLLSLPSTLAKTVGSDIQVGPGYVFAMQKGVLFTLDRDLDLLPGYSSGYKDNVSLNLTAAAPVNENNPSSYVGVGLWGIRKFNPDGSALGNIFTLPNIPSLVNPNFALRENGVLFLRNASGIIEKVFSVSTYDPSTAYTLVETETGLITARAYISGTQYLANTPIAAAQLSANAFLISGQCNDYAGQIGTLTLSPSVNSLTGYHRTKTTGTSDYITSLAWNKAAGRGAVLYGATTAGMFIGYLLSTIPASASNKIFKTVNFAAKFKSGATGVDLFSRCDVADNGDIYFLTHDTATSILLYQIKAGSTNGVICRKISISNGSFSEGNSALAVKTIGDDVYIGFVTYSGTTVASHCLMKLKQGESANKTASAKGIFSGAEGNFFIQLTTIAESVSVTTAAPLPRNSMVSSTRQSSLASTTGTGTALGNITTGSLLSPLT